MLTDSEDRYGLVSRLLHWIVALLIVGLIALGWYLVGLSYYDRWYNTSLEWHRALGMVALLAGALFVLWSMVGRKPADPPSSKSWERLAARAMHWTLLAMILAVPVTGYVISTSAGAGVSIFGWFEIPALLPESEATRDLAIELHYYLAYATAVLVVLHVGAVLKHQFMDRDGTLRKMI